MLFVGDNKSLFLCQAGWLVYCKKKVKGLFKHNWLLSYQDGSVTLKWHMQVAGV